MREDSHPAVGSAPAAGSGVLEPGPRTPAQNYDVGLLDLDGVVYTGAAAVPEAVGALDRARAAGMRLAFVTNNASRSPSAIAEHLNRLGVVVSARDIVTSAQAAATLIAGRFPAGSPVLVVGAMALRLALRERGLRPVSVAADRPVAVVQGYTPDLSYGLLTEAALAIRAGAAYIATNADPTLPTVRGLQPGNGSLLQVLITATGVSPAVAGKPEPPLHAEAVSRTGATRPLVVGDRLDTDIAGAVRGGADSLLVLTGVSTPRDAVVASPGERPTYIALDLRGLLEPQPVIGPRGSGDAGGSAGQEFRCGGWVARRADGRGDGAGQLEISGAGAWIDGLRALCAASWSGSPVTPDMADQALAALGPGAPGSA